MAAQLICNQWVAGSTPVTSSKSAQVIAFIAWAGCFLQKMMRKSIKDHESEQISCRINTGFWFWTMIRLRKYLFSLEWPNRWKWNRFFAESSWQSGIEMVRYTGSQRWLKIESGRVPEWPMGTDCKSAAFQLRWFESTRAHQKSSSVITPLELFVLRACETHECGWIRTGRLCEAE